MRGYLMYWGSTILSCLAVLSTLSSSDETFLWSLKSSPCSWLEFYLLLPETWSFGWFWSTCMARVIGSVAGKAIKVLPRKVLKKIKGMIGQQGPILAFWPVCKMDRDTVLTRAAGTPDSNHTRNITGKQREEKGQKMQIQPYHFCSPHATIL